MILGHPRVADVAVVGVDDIPVELAVFVYARFEPARRVHLSDARLFSMTPSDQLTDLADRTRRLEDAAAAAAARNRAMLEQEREKLHAAMEKEAKDLQSSAKATETEARSWWAETTTHIEQRRAQLRAEIDQRRAERKLEKAKRNADDAEDYAAGLVSLAAYVIDAAEYAVVDAAIARGEADELAAAN